MNTKGEEGGRKQEAGGRKQEKLEVRSKRQLFGFVR